MKFSITLQKNRDQLGRPNRAIPFRLIVEDLRARCIWSGVGKSVEALRSRAEVTLRSPIELPSLFARDRRYHSRVSITSAVERAALREAIYAAIEQAPGRDVGVALEPALQALEGRDNVGVISFPRSLAPAIASAALALATPGAASEALLAARGIDAAIFAILAKRLI